MTIIINPYKRGSRSAKALKDHIIGYGVKAFIGQKPPVHSQTLIVSWGNSEFDYPLERYVNVVNHPGVIGYLTNKIKFFRRVGHDGMVPEWTTSREEAEKWGVKLLARQKLEASGGAGIVIWDPAVDKGKPLPPAPLYVKYEGKSHEFRLHMARSLRGEDFEPLLVQRKIFQKTPERPVPTDWNIRNHSNGFVFVRESGYPTPPMVVETAKTFMRTYFKEIHFAALDVIYHEKRRTAFVLEGNTAPGLEGNTIEVYSEYLRGLAKEARQ